MQNLDQQLRQWSPKLSDDLGIDTVAANALATTVANEVASLPDPAKAELVKSSPVPLRLRIEEVIGFQLWMDFVRRQPHPPPEMVRAQVITQNYICFVYLGEPWFIALRKLMPSGTATKKLSVS